MNIKTSLVFLLKNIKKIFSYLLSLLLSSILIPRDVIFTIANIKYAPQPRLYPSWLNRSAVGLCTKHIYGKRKIDTSLNELIVVCLVRNGEKFIKHFVDYYTKLGTKHIVFLDNDSTDNTLKLASRYGNVTILQCKLPYRTYAWGFKPYLLNRFGKNCWILCADIDEFFDYPYSNKISIESFLRYQNSKSYNAVVAQLLDMFSDKPISCNKSSKSIFMQYPYYDISDIQKRDLPGNNLNTNSRIKFYIGGIRASIFGLNKIHLTKIPLLFIDNKLTADDFRTHYIPKNAKISDLSCVLFHYKFTKDFYREAEEAVKEKNYFKNSYQYKKYLEMIKENADLNIKELAFQPQRFYQIDDLIKNNYLYVSDNFRKYVNKYQ